MGRTELKIHVSRAKYREEAAESVQKFTAPPNLDQNPSQTNFRANTNWKKQNVRVSKNEMTGIV